MFNNANSSHFPIWKANIFYGVYILSFIGLSKLVVRLTSNPTILTLTTQLGMILPFILIGYYLISKETGNRIKTFFHLSRVNIKTIIITIFIAFFSRVIFDIINAIVISNFPDYFNPSRYSNGDAHILIVLLTSGIIVGTCEELLYRGCLYEMFGVLGKTNCMIFTSFLFALNHFDMYNFLGTFFMGCMFYIIRDRTGSILPAIVLHIIINSLSETNYISHLSNLGLFLLLCTSVLVIGVFLNFYKPTKVITSKNQHTKNDIISYIIYVIPIIQFVGVIGKLIR